MSDLNGRYQEEDNPWLRLDDHYWDELTDHLVPAHYISNSVIYTQGDRLNFVFIVKKGRVRISYYGKESEERGIYVAETGSMFGETVALPGYPTNYTATAIVDTDLYLIPAAQVMEKVRTDPAFAEKMVLMLSRKVRIYASQEIELSSLETYDRICHTLRHITQTYGQATADGTLIKIRFTHQELAAMAHVSRVSVSNVFSDLTKKGILSKKNGHYLIRDVNALTAEH